MSDPLDAFAEAARNNNQTEAARRIADRMQSSLMYSVTMCLVRSTAANDPVLREQLVALLDLWKRNTLHTIQAQGAAFDQVKDQPQAAELKEMVLKTQTDAAEALIKNFRQLAGLDA
jgi:hypothetical protein